MYTINQHIKKEMKFLFEKMIFEQAGLLKNNVKYLENYQSKSVVVSTKFSNVDVFSIIKEDNEVFINYLMVLNGTIVQTKTIHPEVHLDETAGEILTFSVAQIRSTFNSSAKEIIVPFPIEYPEEGIVITVPKAGEKKKLLDLSEKNAMYFIEEMKHRQRLKL